jgi:hypothetical protein
LPWKTLLLASALALATAGAAFSETAYTDGSAYNDATGDTTSPQATYALGANQTATDATAWHANNDPKVIRSGPSYDDLGGP